MFQEHQSEGPKYQKQRKGSDFLNKTEVMILGYPRTELSKMT